MNCQEFLQANLDALHGVGAMETHAIHAANCTCCAAWLDEQRALTKDLRALAEADRRALMPPPQIEADLLAALRRQTSAQNFTAAKTVRAAAPIMLPRVPFMQRKFTFSRRQFATAACLLIALTSFAVWRGVTPETIAFRSAQTIFAADGKIVALKIPAEINFASPPVSDVGQDVSKATAIHNPARPTVSAVNINYRPTQVQPRGNSSASKRGNSSERFSSHEIKTAFFPLNGAESLPQTDEWQIIRVRLPRSALANYGLTLNPVASNERVTADIMIGGDGLARAIRFVR